MFTWANFLQISWALHGLSEMFLGLKTLWYRSSNSSNAFLFSKQCTHVPTFLSWTNFAFRSVFRWWETSDCSIPNFSAITQTHSSPFIKCKMILYLLSSASILKNVCNFFLPLAIISTIWIRVHILFLIKDNVNRFLERILGKGYKFLPVGIYVGNHFTKNRK